MFVKIKREFENNVCSYQPSHKVSISCVICENVYIDYYFSYNNNPTCSRECRVKYNTIPCFDCQKVFLKTTFSGRCSLCYDLNKQKLEQYVPEELRKLAKKYKITRKKKNIYNK